MSIVAVSILLSGFAPCDTVILTQKPITIIDWVEYTDADKGFSIQHPPNWNVKRGKGALLVSSKEGDNEWMIAVSALNNSERLEFLAGEDIFEPTSEETTPITIDGVEGTHTIKTFKLFPDMVYHTIVFKTAQLYFQIENSGVKGDEFRRFYESFRFI